MESVVELAFRSGRTAEIDILIEAMERKLIPAIAAVNSFEKASTAPMGYSG
jgi:hypothetical protein